jgi:hypothetical protein
LLLKALPTKPSGDIEMARWVGITALFVCALLSVAAAQEQPKRLASNEQALVPYIPDLATIMIITQQRFSNLSYAPERNNWNLAAYEARHLRRSFDVAIKFYPVFQDIQQEKLIHDVTEPALNRIDKAITNKDLPGFVGAFEALRIACNDCHIRAKVGFIAIGSPLKALTGPQSKEPRERK